MEKVDCPSKIKSALRLVQLLTELQVANPSAALVIGISYYIGKLVAQLVTAMIEFAVQVILAALILAVGNWVAKKVKSLITEAGLPNAAASLASVAILFLTIAMALRQLGLAQDIINIAFGLMLGAVAVGTALAIGLGSKDIAGREVEAMLEKLRK